MSKNSIFTSVTNEIIKTAESYNKADINDYMGDDGLLYCGKCRTPKQCVVEWVDGKNRTMPTPCKCKVEEEERYRELEKLRKKVNRIKSLKSSSLMDEKFASSSFDNLEETEENKRQILICKRYSEKFDELSKQRQGLLLFGGTGTGKTHLACCVGNYLMEHYYSVYVTSIVKVLQKAKGFKSYDDEDEFIDKIAKVDLLIIDDLGAERNTDYALELVYNIIDSRYRTGKPMIVTTNLSLKDMQKSDDIRLNRIYDRILETCYPVEFKGKSRRMKEAANRFKEMSELLEG